MSDWQLAQLNIARMVAPIDSPPMADFVANLPRINATAESSRGFVWRLMTPAGDATGVDHPFDADVIVNLSVWRDVEALRAFTYRTGHADIMRRRREWFVRESVANLVLWWVPAGHEPSVVEAHGRLEGLRANGPTPEAFTFRHAFPPPDATADGNEEAEEGAGTSRSAARRTDGDRPAL